MLIRADSYCPYLIQSKTRVFVYIRLAMAMRNTGHTVTLICRESKLSYDRPHTLCRLRVRKSNMFSYVQLPQNIKSQNSSVFLGSFIGAPPRRPNQTYWRDVWPTSGYQHILYVYFMSMIGVGFSWWREFTWFSNFAPCHMYCIPTLSQFSLVNITVQTSISTEKHMIARHRDIPY